MVSPTAGDDLSWIFLSLILFFNLVNFILYFVDKKKAQYDRWRISEPTLLGFGIIAPFGGLMGMFIMRHKTKHWYFWLNNVFFAILWIIMGIALVSSYGWCGSSNSMVPCIVTACLIAVGGLAAVYCVGGELRYAWQRRR